MEAPLCQIRQRSMRPTTDRPCCQGYAAKLCMYRSESSVQIPGPTAKRLIQHRGRNTGDESWCGLMGNKLHYLSTAPLCSGPEGLFTPMYRAPICRSASSDPIGRRASNTTTSAACQMSGMLRTVLYEAVRQLHVALREYVHMYSIQGKGQSGQLNRRHMLGES